MKRVMLSVALTLWLFSIFSPGAIHADQKSLMAELEGVDSVEAVAIANNWRWTNQHVRVFVDSQEIVFTFPDGQVKKIPMPEDKMLVAVAPYINKTHT